MAQQPPAVDDPRRWWGLAVLCTALCAVVIDNTVLNVALPTLRRTLDASESDLQWITTAYALTLAGLLLPFGVLGDRFGRRGMLLAGLCLFGVASVAAAFTTSPLQLSLARGAMGIGGAATTMASVPAARAGSAAGVNETLVEAGGAVGVAVLGSTLAAGSGFGTPVLVAAGACLGAAAGVWWLLRPTPRATLAPV